MRYLITLDLRKQGKQFLTATEKKVFGERNSGAIVSVDSKQEAEQYARNVLRLNPFYLSIHEIRE